MRRIHFISILAAGSLALLSSCDIQAQAKERSYGLAGGYRLNKTDILYLEDIPGGDSAEAPLLGALEMLCGSPENPRFMLLEDWVDEGYNPNYPSFEIGDDGSGELSKDELGRITEDNKRVFNLQLEAIEEGDYDSLVPFRGAPRLQETWGFLLSDYRAGDVYESEEDFKADARDTIEGWYPSLQDSADLYRLECLHCHGTEGSGDGVTAPFLNPRPRNYQPGVFKWTALKDKAHPRREDLYNVISEGAYTSSMPNFKRFSRAQIHGLVDMVRLLSIRGETERMLAIELNDESPLTPELISQTYADIWNKWLSAADSLIVYDGEVPMPTPEIIARGREVYMDPNGGNCFSCHGDLGLGDGASAWEEVDGASQRIVDHWGEEIIPRNLTTGIYRGGGRPIDVYRRIVAGINGTPMPAVPDTLTEDDRWAVVHYVLSLAEVHEGLGLESKRTRAGGEDHDGDHSDDHSSDGGH